MLITEQNIKIHVIIPCYNMAQYVEKCVRSLLDGTYQNFELVCINDGSKDDTLSVLKKLAGEDNRITVIDQPNGGVSSARNAGLRHVAQFPDDYVAFADPDDWFQPQYLEVLYYLKCEYNATLAIVAYDKVFDRDNCTVIQYSKDEIVRNVDVMNFDFFMLHWKGKDRSSVWGKLYEIKDIIGLFFIESLVHAQDEVFNFAFYGQRNVKIIAACSLPLVNYWQRPDSTMHTLVAQKVIDKMRQHNKMANNEDFPWVVRKNLAEMVVKGVILQRYFAMFDKTEQEKYSNYAKEIFQKNNKILFFFSWYTRILLFIFYYFPMLFRIYLHMKNHQYFSAWEKEQKKTSIC